MKKIFAVLAILIFTQISPYATESCADKVSGGFIPQTSEPSVLLCKSEIAIGYSKDKKTPLWVAYYMTPAKTLAPPAVNKRPRFRIDPSMSASTQASLEDYLNSGYDRGHLAPFEDMNHTVISAVESMMLSNIIPQNQINNRGIWKALEEKIRRDSTVGSKYIIVGPIYENYTTTIGDNIAVPTKLFRIIVDVKTKKVDVYIIPNTDEEVHVSNLPKYLSTLYELERLTGFSAFVAK